MKQKPTEANPKPQPNPIEAAPHKEGNLIISREQGLYRFATPEEIEYARTNGKNLYRSHFVGCKYAKSFRKERKKK